MLGSVRVCRYEGQIDLRLHHIGDFNLCLFPGLLQSLKGHSIFSEINPLIFLKLIGQIVDEALVKVISAEMGIPVGRFDFKDAVTQLKNGNIKSSATEVED